MANNNRGGGLWVGLIVGGAVGTVAGLLLAPRSGRQTRQILKKSADALPELAEDLATTLQLQADTLSDSTQKRWNQTLDRLREAIAAGIEASQGEGVKSVESLDREVTLEARDGNRE